MKLILEAYPLIEVGRKLGGEALYTLVFCIGIGIGRSGIACIVAKLPPIRAQQAS